MRKQLVLLVFGFLMSFSVFSQSNLEANVKTYLSKVQSNLELVEAEKEKLYELKLVHTKSYWDVTKEYKGTSELAEKRKEVGTAYFKSLVAAFGRERAVQISEAFRK